MHKLSTNKYKVSRFCRCAHRCISLTPTFSRMVMVCTRDLFSDAPAFVRFRDVSANVRRRNGESYGSPATPPLRSPTRFPQTHCRARRLARTRCTERPRAAAGSGCRRRCADITKRGVVCGRGNRTPASVVGTGSPAGVDGAVLVT